MEDDPRINIVELMVKNQSMRFVVMVLLALLVRSAEVRATQRLSIEETLTALGKGHALGPATAPVTIVEFTDFQCSFCRKFWADTLPKLKATYIKQGKVRLVYRHFAILGNFSEQAAMASECAGEQGKFWEYHDKLFANQGGFAFTTSKLKQYARELKLDGKKFGPCVDSGRYRRRVAGETAVAATLGARGTPTFFINGQLLVGAQPFEVFRAVIEKNIKADTLEKVFAGRPK